MFRGLSFLQIYPPPFIAEMNDPGRLVTVIRICSLKSQSETKMKGTFQHCFSWF